MVWVPVVFYGRDGERHVIGGARVDPASYGSDIDLSKYEINLNDAGLSARKERREPQVEGR